MLSVRVAAAVARALPRRAGLVSTGGWLEGGRCLESTHGSRATRDKVPLTTRDRGRFQETTPMRPDSSTWKREQAMRNCQDLSGAQRGQSGHGGGFVPPTVTPEATAQGLR